MPLVSVIIPTYNRASLIGETLDSVLAQTFRDFEIIVVDDGSTDETAALIDSNYRHNVRYIRQENGGQAAARNTGIRAAGGRYIAFVDDDDLWLPEKLAIQVARLETGEAAWVYCDAEVFDGATGDILHNYSQINPPHAGWVAASLFERDFIASPTPLLRRSVFDRCGYFAEDKIIKRREDWEMWLRVAACYPVEYVAQALARYRFHHSSVTPREDAWTIYHSRSAVIDRAVAFAPEVYGPVRAQAMAALCLFTGRQLALAGQAAQARAMFAQAIRRQPGALAAYPHWLVSWFGGTILQKLARSLLQLRGKLHQTTMSGR